jgi:hypothetical protein
MDSALLTVLINSGAFGVIAILFMTGWIVPKPVYSKVEKERDTYKQATEVERKRANEAENNSALNNRLLQTIIDIAVDNRKVLGPPVTAGDPLSHLIREDDTG